VAPKVIIIIIIIIIIYLARHKASNLAAVATHTKPDSKAHIEHQQLPET